jgi:hypothetical protein
VVPLYLDHLATLLQSVAPTSIASTGALPARLVSDERAPSSIDEQIEIVIERSYASG